MSDHPANDEFVRLYSACERDLFRYILTMVPSHQDALDLLQETAGDLWQKFTEYDPSRPFESWARRFAHLRILKFREQSRASIRKTSSFGDDVMAVLAEERERHEGILELRRRALDGCMEKVQPTDRNLLEHRYWKESSIQEIARAEGQSPQRLYDRLRAIREQLQKCIDRTLASISDP